MLTATIDLENENMIREFTVYYLEITESGNAGADMSIPDNIRIKRVTEPSPALNRFFYLKIGAAWDWIDRKNWTVDQWRQYVDQADLETWVVHFDSAPAGYFELLHEPEQRTQIAYLGLLPEFTGKGLGGYLTRFAIQRAFDVGAKKVWLSTCSLDHPAALKTYLKCGFKLVREEVVRKEFPDE